MTEYPVASVEVADDQVVLHGPDDRIARHAATVHDWCLAGGLAVLVVDDLERDNVIALDANGSEIWRIQPDDETAEDPYVAVSSEDGELRLFRFYGTTATVSPETGEILAVGFAK